MGLGMGWWREVFGAACSPPAVQETGQVSDALSLETLVWCSLSEVMW